MKKQQLSAIFRQAQRAEAMVSAEETVALLNNTEKKGSNTTEGLRWLALGGVLCVGVAILSWFVWQEQWRDTSTHGIGQDSLRTNAVFPPDAHGWKKGDTLSTLVEYHFRVPGKRQIIPPYLQNKNIAGVRMLFLTPKELLALGLRGMPDGSVQHYQGRKSFDVPVDKRIGYSPVVGHSPSGSYLSILELTRTGQRYVWIPNEELAIPLQKPLYPRLVTDAEGRTRLARFVFKNIAENRIASMERSLAIHTFVPVFVPCTQGRNGKDTAIAGREGYIFWYEATPEFLQALPERIRQQLAPETEAAEELHEQVLRAINGNRPVPIPTAVLREGKAVEEHSTNETPRTAPAELRFTGDDAVYYDMWRSAVGAITSSLLYPNPVQGLAASVVYTIDDDRMMSITLHDVSGACIAELLAPQKRTRGEHSERIALPHGIASGLYLVVIQSNRGEHAVQRLIVQ